jgi:hypothetical protein
MHIQLQHLIKEAPVGETLKSRGGVRNRYRHFIFVKVKKNTVWVFDAHTWRSLKAHWPGDGSGEQGNLLCVCNPEGVHFKLIRDPRSGCSQNYRTWDMDGFFSLNLLYNCYMRWVNSTHIVHTSNQEYYPQAKMSFDWEGNMITPVTKKAQKAYEKWDRDLKDHRNALARARYKQNKAERIFKKHRKDGTLDKWDASDVFSLKNAQLRQQAIEAVGMERVTKSLESKTLDVAFFNGSEYQLVQFKIPAIVTGNNNNWNSTQNEKWATYLKMINPSTGEIHLEGVPLKSDNSWDYIPEHTVKGALAWRDGENLDSNNGRKSDNWSYSEPKIIT